MAAALGTVAAGRGLGGALERAARPSGPPERTADAPGPFDWTDAGTPELILARRLWLRDIGTMMTGKDGGRWREKMEGDGGRIRW